MTERWRRETTTRARERGSQVGQARRETTRAQSRRKLRDKKESRAEIGWEDAMRCGFLPFFCAASGELVVSVCFGICCARVQPRKCLQRI